MVETSKAKTEGGMISDGDMVVVVRCCCSEYVHGHWVFRVHFVHDEYVNQESGCQHCGANLPKELFAAPLPGTVGAPLSWLKKIDPLDEPAETYDVEGVSA